MYTSRVIIFVIRSCICFSLNMYTSRVIILVITYKLYLLQGEYVHIHCLILIEGLQVCDSQIRRDLNENSNPVVVTTLEGLPFLFTEKPKYIFHELLTEKHKYIFHELESLIYFA